jgi:hypothetical protein
MLVKAMEVSGIEGNFRSTCENVMQVLRIHKDSVMAMMEVCTPEFSCYVFTSGSFAIRTSSCSKFNYLVWKR